MNQVGRKTALKIFICVGFVIAAIFFFSGVTVHAMTIKTGTYYEIQSTLNNNKVLDISGNATASGAKTQLYSRNNSWAQRFEIQSVGNGYYTLFAAGSRNAIDVSGGHSWNYTAIQQYTSNGTAAQKWKIQSNDDGTVTFISATDGRHALDVLNAGTNNGQKIQLYDSNGTKAQKWILNEKGSVPNVSGWKTIHTGLNTNRVVDVTSASYYDGANIQTYQNNGTGAQRFNFQKYNDGSYRIVNGWSEKAIDVAGGSKKNGANVQQYRVNNTDAQKWIVLPSGNGYIFRNKCNGGVLDVANGVDRNGTNIWVYTINNTRAQRFTLTNTNAVTIPQREKIIRVARSQIGYHEGNNNYTKYGTWFAGYKGYTGSLYTAFSHGSWCAMFASWCGHQTGLSNATWYYHAYCPTGVSWYQRKGQWHWKSNYTPRTADLIYYDWNGDKIVDHVGLVENVSGNKVNTVEGNYNDQVKRRSVQKNSKDIFGYAAPLK